MVAWLYSHYKWIEASHVISVIMWMAGMLYLPRLCVYHTQVARNSESDSMLSLMERRLLIFIMTPAMAASFSLGITLAILKRHYLFVWFQIKFALILAMLSIHGLLAKHVWDFSKGANRRPALYFRIINELVTLLIIAIVIMAVIKPYR